MKQFTKPFAQSVHTNHTTVLCAALFVGASLVAQAQFFGVNFAGDPALAASQALLETDGAGLIRQKFWNNGSGRTGQVAVEGDAGTSMSIFYSGFSAQWQAGNTGSDSISGVLPNFRLMKGSVVGTGAEPVLVQFSGVPIPLTSGGYAALVYCDSPANSSNVVLKVTIEGESAPRSLYLQDPANRPFAGNFLRVPQNSSSDRAAQTPAGNVAVFTGLKASELAILIEPASSTPSGIAAVSAVQLVPSSAVQVLAPRVVSSLSLSTPAHEPITYQIQTDFTATSWNASGLPAGLQLNPTTGLISGTPVEPGTSLVQLTVGNSAGSTTEELALTVTGTAVAGPLIYMVPAIQLRGEVGQTNRVEYTDNLANPVVWKESAAVVLTNTVQFHVDLAATNAPRRFYRVTVE